MKKVLIENKKDLVSIPNLLGYFRLILVPVYLYLYYHATTPKEYLLAALVIGVSGFTDMIDGKIARRFDMVTEFGKVLDPVADKVTQAAVAVSLISRYKTMGYFFALFLVRESFMAINGMIMLRRGQMMNGARWYGKVSTAAFYILLFVLLLDVRIPLQRAEIMIWGCFILLAASFAGYIRYYYLEFRKLK